MSAGWEYDDFVVDDFFPPEEHPDESEIQFKDPVPFMSMPNIEKLRAEYQKETGIFLVGAHGRLSAAIESTLLAIRNISNSKAALKSYPVESLGTPYASCVPRIARVIGGCSEPAKNLKFPGKSKPLKRLEKGRMKISDSSSNDGGFNLGKFCSSMTSVVLLEDCKKKVMVRKGKAGNGELMPEKEKTRNEEVLTEKKKAGNGDLMLEKKKTKNEEVLPEQKEAENEEVLPEKKARNEEVVTEKKKAGNEEALPEKEKSGSDKMPEKKDPLTGGDVEVMKLPLPVQSFIRLEDINRKVAIQKEKPGTEKVSSEKGNLSSSDNIFGDASGPQQSPLYNFLDSSVVQSSLLQHVVQRSGKKKSKVSKTTTLFEKIVHQVGQKLYSSVTESLNDQYGNTCATVMDVKKKGTPDLCSPKGRPSLRMHGRVPSLRSRGLNWSKYSEPESTKNNPKESVADLPSRNSPPRMDCVLSQSLSDESLNREIAPGENACVTLDLSTTMGPSSVGKFNFLTSFCSMSNYADAVNCVSKSDQINSNSQTLNLLSTRNLPRSDFWSGKRKVKIDWGTTNRKSV